MNTVRLILGNSLVKLQDLDDCSVDYIVSDPPYELTNSNRTKPPPTSDSPYGRHRVGVNGDNSPLPVESPLTTKRGFMGKEWDGSGIAFSVELWGQCLRVLKPNGVIKAFSGTRTFHRMAKAMREAGFVDFEIHAWTYGCLSEDTEVLTQDGWVQYRKATVGTSILGYDPQSGVFDWQPVEETFEYPYDRKAFHLIGDGTDHIVSTGHRCLVQRAGKWTFVSSDDLGATEVVPGVQGHFHAQTGKAGDMRTFLCRPSSETSKEAFGGTEGSVSQLHGLRDTQVVCRCLDPERDQAADVLQKVQWGASRSGLGEAWPQGGRCCNARGAGIGHPEDDRLKQPCLEGRGDVLQQTWELRTTRSDQVHPLSIGVPCDGPQGWVRDGASVDRGASTGSMPASNGDSTPPKPQPNRQPTDESGAVRFESGSQTVRGSWDTPPYLAGVVTQVKQIHYTGIVWCVRVPTGAFVARRNGMAFVTGNSGFPKSMSVSKALDKMAGVNKATEIEIQAYLKVQRESLGLSKGDVDHQVFGGTTRYSWVEGRGGDYASYLPTPEEWALLKTVLHLDNRYDAYIQEAIPSRKDRFRADGGKAIAVGEEPGDWGYQKDDGRWEGTRKITVSATEAAKQWAGYGTALKPAFEPIVVARKPL